MAIFYRQPLLASGEQPLAAIPQVTGYKLGLVLAIEEAELGVASFPEEHFYKPTQAVNSEFFPRSQQY